ncbi:MAG: hypothetical protein K8T90_04250 [Planctomycetes bacterium]|nr:hypothetical protein [Planctomycetota bacterium]
MTQRALPLLLLFVAACGGGEAAPALAPAPRASTGEPRAQLPTYRVLASDDDHGPLMQPVVALVPSDDAAITDALAAGIRCAFAESAAAGGPTLALRVSTKTAAWGSAVEGAIRDAVDTDAVALIAPPERRHTHLLVQLGTKVRLPVFSTSAARSAVSAGSPWVIAVAPTSLGVGDGPPVPPAFDVAAPASSSSASRAFVEAFRAANGRDPGPWDAVGFDAGRAVVEGVRRNGLHRPGLLGSLVHGDAIRGASGDFSFEGDGARRSVTVVPK